MCARFDMVTSDRSTAGLRAADRVVCGHLWPPGQLPPATDHLRPAPPASATRQARMGFSVDGGSRLPQQLRVDDLVAHLLTSST
jgi:hypothetical protein